MTSRFTQAFVIGALATIGAIAWTGCGDGSGERYYCDNSGCYSCDGYGCTTVKPPAKASCGIKATCTSGTVCTTVGCAVLCKASTDCPRGETCQVGGICAAPGTDPGTIISTPDGGAPDGGGDGGPVITNVSCGTGPACTGDTVCVSGECTAPQNACQFTSECGDPAKVCADGACLKPCTAAGTCDDGFTCTKNVCQPNATTGDGGTTDPNACTTDPQCGDGKYCKNLSCVVDTRPKPNCKVDEDCGGTAGTPKKCLAGYCKYPCTTDAYCLTIDKRIGICAKDGVCRSSTEAAAQCTGPGTCPLAGQSCINNQCN